MNHWDERYIRLAEYISGWSKDPSTKVGAVITGTRNRVVSVGFNGLPAGVTDREERLVNRDLKLRMIVHAEMNAMAFAERSLEGCTLYTWPFMPCSNCAAVIIQRGIKRVVAPKPPGPGQSRWETSFAIAHEMFGEAGVSMHYWEDEVVLPWRAMIMDLQAET